jgi:hypothetical protein
MTGDGRAARLMSARQRTVVLTFATVEDAEQWDAEPSVWRLIDAIQAEAATAPE